MSIQYDDAPAFKQVYARNNIAKVDVLASTTLVHALHITHKPE